MLRLFNKCGAKVQGMLKTKPRELFSRISWTCESCNMAGSQRCSTPTFWYLWSKDFCSHECNVQMPSMPRFSFTPSRQERHMDWDRRCRSLKSSYRDSRHLKDQLSKKHDFDFLSTFIHTHTHIHTCSYMFIQFIHIHTYIFLLCWNKMKQVVVRMKLNWLHLIKYIYLKITIS